MSLYWLRKNTCIILVMQNSRLFEKGFTNLILACVSCLYDACLQCLVPPSSCCCNEYSHVLGNSSKGSLVLNSSFTRTKWVKLWVHIYWHIISTFFMWGFTFDIYWNCLFESHMGTFGFSIYKVTQMARYFYRWPFKFYSFF